MSGADSRLTDALAGLLAELLGSLEALDIAQRRLQPASVGQLGEALERRLSSLEDAIVGVRDLEWPTHVEESVAQLGNAGTICCEALSSLAAASGGAGDVMGCYRALRKRFRALELLYPLCSSLSPIDRFFLESDSTLERGPVETSVDAERPVGIVRPGPGSAADFALYVPEDFAVGQRRPLIVALHGGSGRGEDFLWTWLREARSRGCILLSPTAMGQTWSLMDPRFDGEAVLELVEWIDSVWGFDSERALLTGMSDGGTFTLAMGLWTAKVFTHLAPVSGVLPPLDSASQGRVAGRRIRWVHGALDWMFPVAVAQMATAELGALGAQVVYREIDDLAHTYPREENAAILDWVGIA